MYMIMYIILDLGHVYDLRFRINIVGEMPHTLSLLVLFSWYRYFDTFYSKQ